MDAMERREWSAYRASGDVDLRNRLVERHVRLVHHFARRMEPRAGGRLDLDELTSAGFLGLMSAVESYDPDRGCRFSTYAAPRIRGAMLDELRRHDPLPRSARRRQQQVAEAEQRLASRMERSPDHSEVSNALGVPAATLWRWKGEAERARSVSLEEAVAGADRSAGRRCLGDVLSADAVAEVEERLAVTQEAARLVRELEGLDARERRILQLYDLRQWRLRDVAAVLEVTESRVSQLRSRALRRLRDRMGDLRSRVAA